MQSVESYNLGSSCVDQLYNYLTLLNICCIVILVLVYLSRSRIKTMHRHFSRFLQTSSNSSKTPNYDTVEWLNRIIREIWISDADYILSLIFSKEQNIQSQYASFKFLDVSLGDVPFRVKTMSYSDSERPSIDLELTYVGNCHLTFEIYGFIKGGIKDFQLHGTVRVLITPSIEAKMCIEVYFLSEPTIDFEATGVLNYFSFKDKVIDSILDVINSNLLTPYKVL